MSHLSTRDTTWMPDFGFILLLRVGKMPLCVTATTEAGIQNVLACTRCVGASSRWLAAVWMVSHPMHAWMLAVKSWPCHCRTPALRLKQDLSGLTYSPYRYRFCIYPNTLYWNACVAESRGVVQQLPHHASTRHTSKDI